MMLVHKQPPLHLPQQIQHRRLPSAPPAVIVHPTRTPGLLSLSKPIQQQKSTPHRQLPSNQRKQPRQALINTAEITDKKNATHPGRAAKKQAKENKQAASESKSTPTRAHGKHARQPSPPLFPSPSPSPSQAEVIDNAADPFLDSFSPSTFKPLLAAKPSGKLANRRHPQTPASPTATPTKAIPVPAMPRLNTQHQHLSRSAPTVAYSWDHICDDSNEEDPATPPATPIRSRPHYDSDGPYTAPLSSVNAGAFPFNTPTPSQRKARNHRRIPSDHIFNMSSDDEASGTEDLRALLNFVRTGSRPSSTTTTPPPHRVVDPDYLRSLSPASRELYFELEAQKEVAGYFASSSFQNSPSPEDLPAPDF